jgi:hypothetical protein
MKIKVNTKTLEALNPCQDRLARWKKHCNDFSGDIVEFLDLPAITHKDKIWVACRLLPRLLVEVFAFDCSLEAENYADHAAAYTIAYVYAAWASTAASIYATYTAAAYDYTRADDYAATATRVASYTASAYAHTYADTSAVSKEQQRQIKSLIHLIQTTPEKELEGL